MSHICKKKMFCTALQDPAVSFEQGPSNHLGTGASCPGICLGLRDCYLGSVHMPWHWGACTENGPLQSRSQWLILARRSLGRIDHAHAGHSVFLAVSEKCAYLLHMQQSVPAQMLHLSCEGPSLAAEPSIKPWLL